MTRGKLPVALVCLLPLAAAADAQDNAAQPALQTVQLKEVEGGLEATLEDGRLFTRYVLKSGAKPILWPLLGPAGEPLTRGYPMQAATPEEREDHIHHRSFWFTHGDVNGVSFWHEQGENGEILHREFLVKQSGTPAVISTRNDWVAPSGQRLCQDVRTFRLFAAPQARWLDCEITVSAPDDDVRFGDTKEGAFGVRVAGAMKVDAKQGGRILNSEGLTDGQAWGKPAAWVDYSGPTRAGGPVQGVTIMNHPDSFRFPTHWHVRTYGLFAANPFGLHDFVSQDQDGSLLLKKGESFTLKYRVYLHGGDASAASLGERYQEYVGSAGGAGQ